VDSSFATRGSARALTLVLLAALLGAGLLVVAPPVSAEPLPDDPILYVEPDCFAYEVSPNAAPVTTTITVRGRNFERNRDIVVSNYERDFDNPASEVISSSGNYGLFSATITVTAQLYYYYNRITAGYDQGDVQAEVYILGCGTTEINVDPMCVLAGEATSITVEGTGFDSSGGAIVITVYDWNTGQQYAGMERPAAASFTSTVKLPELPAGEYRVEARQDRSGARQWLLAPCPTIEIRPTCESGGAPPDEWSIFVSGRGFLEGHGPEGEGSVDIIFEPERRTQEFFHRVPDFGQLGPGGTFGPVEITPYRRAAEPATYTIEVIQRDFNNADRRVFSRATATFTVPCPVTPSPTPQFRPTLTIEPDCGPPAIVGDTPRTYDVEVTGRGFAPLQAVAVIFDADAVLGETQAPQTFPTNADANGGFTFRIDPDYRPPGSYRIRAVQLFRIGSVEASAVFAVPCAPPAPVLTIDPTCGPAAAGQPQAYVITAVGTGFVGGPVEIVFDPLGAPQTFPATADGLGAFSAEVRPSGRPPGVYSVVARQLVTSGTFAEVTVPFVVACEGALLRITPVSGPRGLVPIIIGANFPPLTNLELSWDRGIDAGKAISVQTDLNGGFTRPVMVYRSDFVGPRRMIVVNPADPEAYLELYVDYLVVLSPMAPPFAGNPWDPSSTMVSR